MLKKKTLYAFLLTVSLFCNKHLLGYMWASMLVYCTVYDICVCGGGHINIFSGPPNPLTMALDLLVVFSLVHSLDSFQVCLI